jgi:hypothetical protein
MSGYSIGDKGSSPSPWSAGPWSSGYQGGKFAIPQTGWYRLHEGERVTPRASAAPGEQIQLTIINKIDSGFVNDMLEANPNTVINIISSDMAKNGTTKKAIASLVRSGR